MKIYLASESPRRRHMLSWLGWPFEVVDHGVDESTYRMEDGKEMVKQLSLAKACGGADQVKDGLVIGSDLTVVLGKEIIGKPKDLVEAKEILTKLSGKTHMIYCGVAVVDVKTEKIVVSVDEVKVTMKAYGEKIINEYIKKFEVLDKGGSYSIAFKLPKYGSLVKEIDGAMTAIIGLPMDYLVNLLKEFGVKPRKDWRKICKLETGYEN